MILVVHIGSSRMKWGLRSPRGWIAHGVTPNAEIGTLALREWQNVPRPVRALGISMLNYAVLATAWAMFSGPTRSISLATVAFFGIGAYTVAIAADYMPYPLVLVVMVAICLGLYRAFRHYGWL